MDRVIKFRAWDKDFKKWSETPLKYAIEDLNHYTDYEWNQFTGLTDRNGVEIYEGDILKLKNSLLTIKFMGDYNFGYILHYAKTNDYHAMLNVDHLKMIEVIGNIYEHPHLLEGGE